MSAGPKNPWTAREAISWGVYGDEEAIASRTAKPPKLRSFEQVQTALSAAVRKGTINSWAFLGKKSGSNSTRRFLNPQLFRDFENMTFDVFGETVPLAPHRDRDFQKYYDAIFEEREIKALFSEDCAKAEIFLRDYMAKHSTTKKATAIEECTKTTGVTVRVAKDAWKPIAANLGRGRGRPIR